MFQLRCATAADAAALKALVHRSAAELSRPYYGTRQVEVALQGALGVDSQLIRDRTYFVVEHGAQIVGCGGFSYRRTLFGGDASGGRDPLRLDPATDAAKIRAFFVEPAFARRGIGRLLLGHCEAQARTRGFQRFELMATLPGVPFYEALGYRRGAPLTHALEAGLSIEFVAMHKASTP